MPKNKPVHIICSNPHWALTPRIGWDEEILEIVLRLNGFDMAFHNQALKRHIKIALRMITDEVYQAIDRRRCRRK